MANFPPYSYMPQQGYPPGYMPQQINQMQNPAQDAFICRPVTCREEAVGTPLADFTRPMLFPDITHGSIYMKRFNPNTGSSDILTFKLSGPEDAPENNYVTRQEFDQFCSNLLRRMTGGREEAENV